MYIVFGALGHTTRIHWQNAAGANGYGVVTETAMNINIIYGIYKRGLNDPSHHYHILLEIAVILEKSKQMLAQRLFVVRLIWLD